MAALEATLALRALAGDLVAIELVAPEQEFSYRPMAVAEPFRVGEVRRFPLEPLVRAAGAELRTGTMTAIDAEQKTVTVDGERELEYDTLLLALGARPSEAVPGALTFRGPQDGVPVEALLEQAAAGRVKRIVFAMPPSASWPLPLYELALLTAESLVDRMTRGVEVVIATPERRPLALFGTAASNAMEELLELREIRFEAGVTPTRFHEGVLELIGAEGIEADAVVALPKLEGVRVEGVPRDSSGFVATNELGWVLGLTDVYAAGDLTQFPVKQGGIAAAQADSAASAIAADAGAHVRPTVFTPVLRGLLLTGLAPRYLRAEHDGRRSLVALQPLWWPPAKIVGRHLSPFLAKHLGLAYDQLEPPDTDTLPIEVALDTNDQRAWSPI